MQAFQHVTVGVADLRVALSLWVNHFGFEIAAEREGPDSELARLWGMTANDINTQALVRSPDQTRGMLHFVEFVEPDSPVRLGAKNYDLVPKNLDVHVVDLPARFGELTGAGYAFSTAAFTEADQSIGGRFREGHLKGHDEMNIVLVEELGVQPWDALPYTAEGYVGVGPLVPVVGDIARETAFYSDVLGFELQSEALSTGPEIEKMVGLPPGTGLATAVLGGAEAFGSIMLVEYRGVDGTDLYPKASPKSLGILHITFAANDLEPLRNRLAAAGVEVTDHGCLNLLFGKGEFISFSSPAGLRIEVFSSTEGMG